MLKELVLASSKRAGAESCLGRSQSQGGANAANGADEDSPSRTRSQPLATRLFPPSPGEHIIRRITWHCAPEGVLAETLVLAGLGFHDLGFPPVGLSVLSRVSAKMKPALGRNSSVKMTAWRIHANDASPQHDYRS